MYKCKKCGWELGEDLICDCCGKWHEESDFEDNDEEDEDNN